jgi:hypothetical protein
MIRIIFVWIFAVLLGMGSGFSMLSQKDRPLAKAIRMSGLSEKDVNRLIQLGTK